MQQKIETVYFIAPLLEGVFLGLPWLPALKPYADRVLDELALALKTHVLEGWTPDADQILSYFNRTSPKDVPLKVIDGVTYGIIEVTFTRPD